MALTRTIWAVHDGRAGIRNQALGLAEAVAAITGAALAERTVGQSGWAERLGFAHDPALNPPWPNLWIGCGRRSVPASVAVRRWSRGSVFVVQVQDPRRDPALFDLVVPPAHDTLMGDNVVPIIGAPNRVTGGRLAEARAHFADRISALPGPRVAVLVGGGSRRHRMDAASLTALSDAIAALRAKGAGIMISTSRRTPEPVRAMIAGLTADPALWVYDGAGENPYFAFLGAADAVLVTRDSVNMLTDAASAGKPVLTLPVTGQDGKFARLYDALTQRGYIRPFRGALETWPVEPLRETARAAREVIDRSSIL